ncbi:hypothetical protein PG988_004621 [Apiospora saccharicola]
MLHHQGLLWLLGWLVVATLGASDITTETASFLTGPLISATGTAPDSLTWIKYKNFTSFSLFLTTLTSYLVDKKHDDAQTRVKLIP